MFTAKFFKRTHDPIWQLQLGIIAIIILQFLTDDSFLPYNKLVIIGFEALLLVAMSVLAAEGYAVISRSRRAVMVCLVALVAIINIFSLIFLVKELVFGTLVIAGTTLLLSALAIYVTNIFMFALLYWELDGGGPDHRVSNVRRRDFVFPQNLYPELSRSGWKPGFIDYLYLSSTNVTNFAAADTMPISHRAKVLMMVQAIVSLITIVLVVTRAIGILG